MVNMTWTIMSVDNYIISEQYCHSVEDVINIKMSIKHDPTKIALQEIITTTIKQKNMI
jgi:homoserine acetyltransferase